MGCFNISNFPFFYIIKTLVTVCERERERKKKVSRGKAVGKKKVAKNETSKPLHYQDSHSTSICCFCSCSCLTPSTNKSSKSLSQHF